jgi:hypothetical protein
VVCKEKRGKVRERRKRRGKGKGKSRRIIKVRRRFLV